MGRNGKIEDEKTRVREIEKEPGGSGIVIMSHKHIKD